MNSLSRSFFFIRHAETALAGTFCGHSDPALNAAGEAQLAGLVARMAPFAFETLLSSDLRRAVQTAEALGVVRGLPVATTPALREIHFGEWETLNWEAIEQRDPAFAARWVTEFPALATPGGEAISSFRQRILEEVSESGTAEDLERSQW